MIGRLRGILAYRGPTRLLVDVGGVGYEVQIPLSTFSILPGEGAEVLLHIHTHVRDDALALFGFATVAEKRLFERLIEVSGIGPRLACTVLSGLPPAELVAAIRAGEAGPLRSVPGIGRKTAERIVLELQDRLSGVAEELAGAGVRVHDGGSEEAVSALVNLGYRERAARAAVAAAAQRIKGPSDLESLLRESLRNLSQESGA